MRILRMLLIPAMFLFILPVAISDSSLPPQIAYCEHMGYEILDSGKQIECIFDDESKCDVFDFYNNFCGEDKIREIEPRQVGQTVYTEFGEICDSGLIPSEPRYLLDQSICIKPSVFDIVKSFFMIHF